MSPAPSPLHAKPVKVAVVGLGFMGVTHLRAYLENPQAQVVAVCGLNRLPMDGKLSGVAGNIKKTDEITLGTGVKVFRKFEDLLADGEIEMVDICTPTPLHPEQVIAALRAGKHVLCEKPLARTSAAAAEILKTAGNSRGFLMPAMCMRFWPGWDWLKKVVAENTYGKVLAARFARHSEMPRWSRAGTYSANGDSGGALFDLHIHDTDFVNYLFGKPLGVFSTGVVGKEGAIDQVVTQYHYPAGPVVHAEGSWLLAQGFQMSYTLHCERGTLDFNTARDGSMLMVTEGTAPPRRIDLEETDGYAGEIRYFVNCVSQRVAPQIVTARDGLTALEICEAEEQSVRSGKFTEI